MKIKRMTNEILQGILSLRQRILETGSWISRVNFVSKQEKEEKKNVFVELEERKKQQMTKNSLNKTKTENS